MTVSDVTATPASVTVTGRQTGTATVNFRLQTTSGLQAGSQVTVVDGSSGARFAPTRATPSTGTDIDGTWTASIRLSAVMNGTHSLTVTACPVGRDCTTAGPERSPTGKTVSVNGTNAPALAWVSQEPRRLSPGRTAGAQAAGRVVFSQTRNPVHGIEVLARRTPQSVGKVVARTNVNGYFRIAWPWPRTSTDRFSIVLRDPRGTSAAFDQTVLGAPATRFSLTRPSAPDRVGINRTVVVTGTVAPAFPSGRLGPVVLESRRGSRWVRVDAASLTPLHDAGGNPTGRASYRLTTHFTTVGGHMLRVRKLATHCAGGPCRIAQRYSDPFAVVAGNPTYFVEQRLQQLGVPIGSTNGTLDARDRQALCAWRDMAGMRPSRAGLGPGLVSSIMSHNRRPAAHRPDGIYVDKTCQILLQVVNGQFRRVVRASTGKPGYDTPNGTGAIFRKLSGWIESTLYPGAFMFDPMFFLPGRPAIALHGSVSNDLVAPSPASHGCVRVWRPQIAKLFRESPIGTLVKVYGQY